MTAAVEYLDVETVMAELKVSQAKAYKMMRAAVGRGAGARGLLRVRRDVWNLYLSRQASVAKNRAEWSAVYFIQENECGPIKIGVSLNAHARLASLQTSTPRPLRLLGVIDGDRKVESALHRRFAHLRTRGEWFRARPELLNFILGNAR